MRLSVVKILAVDTALGACSCAIVEDARILAHRFEIMDRGHAEASGADGR